MGKVSKQVKDHNVSESFSKPEASGEAVSHIERAADQLSRAFDAKQSANFNDAIHFFEEAILSYKQVLSDKPHDSAGRDGLALAWDNIANLYPDLADLDSTPSFKDEQSEAKYQPAFSVKNLRAAFMDNLIESNWQKQCDGKYGGPKPQDKSWKQFYEDNEAQLERLSQSERVLWSVRLGHHRLLDTLIEQGADINIEDDNKEVPLFLAIRQSYTEVALLLIKHGAKVNAKGVAKWTPLHWAVYTINRPVVEALLEAKGKVNVKDVKGLTPLHWAAFKGDIPIAKILLAKKAKVNVATEDGVSPLHWAVFSGYTDMVSLLLDNGAKVNMQDRFKRTLLHWAASKGRDDMSALLLDKGATVDVCDIFDRLPIHWAAQRGHFDVVSGLMQYQAKLNEADKFGDRPLMLAASNNHQRIVQTLFERGGR